MLRCTALVVAVESPLLWLARSARPPHPIDWLHGLHSLALYLPAVFAIEEVFFRGVADAYVDRDDRFGWRSALPIAVAWGLWHLPFVPSGDRLRSVGALVLVHTLAGVPMALYRRRTQSLWPAAWRTRRSTPFATRSSAESHSLRGQPMRASVEPSPETPAA